MSVLSPRAVLAGFAILLLPTLLFARNTSLEELCRLHGIARQEQVDRIGESYREALEAGISEDELLPFVDDILRHKLDCAQMVRVLAAATRLRREGLPYFVVFSKVREGVTKDAPPALVVEAAEAKLRTLTLSRDVLKSLETSGYRVRDFQNAAVVVSSYIEKGYTVGEIVSRVEKKGIEGAGFSALSAVLERPVKSQGH